MGNLHALGIDSPDPVVLILWSVQFVGACALTAQGDKALEERRIRPLRRENSIQPVEPQSTRRSPKTRSPCSSTHVLPIFDSVQGGLLLSFVCSNGSVAEEEQQNPDQSNSRLPVRLASPKIFYQEWIQQGKVPPDQTSSVPVNTQTNCLVKVELDDRDVRGQLPASAV